MKRKFVEVALPLSIERTFSYSVPHNFDKLIKKGMRVKVPFANRQMTGFVAKVTRKPQVSEVKPLISIVDDKPLIDKRMFKLAEEISFLYLASLGEVLKSFIPYGLKKDAGRKSLSKEEVRRDFCKEGECCSETSFSRLSRKLIAKIKPDVFSVNIVHGSSIMKRRFLYLELVRSVLERGQSCLLLVPDMSFIDYLEEFFKCEIGEKKVFSFHSRLRNKDKNLRWFGAENDVKLVIGTPQSVFLPFGKLGLIIVEEEQEPSYKQRTSSRYNAKDTAVLRAELEECPCLLAATVLSLESFYKAKHNRNIACFSLANFQEKIDTQVVDLCTQAAGRFFISKPVEFKILKSLQARERIFIFLNRKGYANYLHCPHCAHIKRCPHCQLPLVYHYSQKRLVCKSCFYEEGPPKLCPECQKAYLKFGSPGIEKLESELSRIFPQARIKTLSADEGGSRYFYEVIKEYERGEIDILVSTQVLAKRPHRMRAELVILALADISLGIPDFRTGEHLFTLMAQMKNLVKPGCSFIIQTFSADASPLKYAIRDDIEAYYKEELKLRHQLDLPPFTSLVQVKVSSAAKKSAKNTAGALEKFLKKSIDKKRLGKKISVSECTPCFYSRLKGRYRWQLTVIGKDRGKLCEFLKEAKENFRAGGSVKLTFDADPQDTL